MADLDRIWKEGSTNSHSILNVPWNANKEQIRQAYLRLSRIFHTDRTWILNDDMFKKLAEAYSTIGNGGRTDLLEPLGLAQRLGRIGWDVYLALVGAWETLLFRGAGLLWIPSLLVAHGMDSARAMAVGVLISGPVFLALHGFIRWLVKSREGGLRGLAREIASDFRLSSP